MAQDGDMPKSAADKGKGKAPEGDGKAGDAQKAKDSQPLTNGNKADSKDQGKTRVLSSAGTRPVLVWRLWQCFVCARMF